jgi:signal transduction histidine kinase
MKRLESRTLEDLRISEGKIRQLALDLLDSQEAERKRIAG